jgi:hypothetical protein
MATPAVKPLPAHIAQLIQEYGEMSYIQGQQMERTLMRTHLGLSMGEEREVEDRRATAERVAVKRERLVDAIRELP